MCYTITGIIYLQTIIKQQKGEKNEKNIYLLQSWISSVSLGLAQIVPYLYELWQSKK